MINSSRIRIRCVDFYDGRRTFIAEYEDTAYFFDWPFDDELDEYPDRIRTAIDATVSDLLT